MLDTSRFSPVFIAHMRKCDDAKNRGRDKLNASPSVLTLSLYIKSFVPLVLIHDCMHLYPLAHRSRRKGFSGSFWFQKPYSILLLVWYAVINAWSVSVLAC
jgi:hypothetical protein